ncbi:hypothetical protein LWI28_024587 [Acer negundo]|uniref:Peptidase A1 domain-containing protein n=1 Tax=Acer negundo TaxID=4023 RepID=A0AAD5J7D6_ACENE|nr:hypothetical protein LWI28_024587 [Acer negundo]
MAVSSKLILIVMITLVFVPVPSSQFQNHNHTKLELVHIDHISSSTKFHNHSHRFLARIQRDIKRVAALTHLLSPAKSYEVENLNTDLVSGYFLGITEYLVRVGIGSPPTFQYLAIDTGSDVIWVQCQPCNMCHKKADPVFNPATSASYTVVLCGSPACDALLVNDRHCHAGKCGYEVNYFDGSYTKGTLMLETLTFGQTRILNLAMGCGHNNHGPFNVITGLLGLGGGRMSFINQIPETGGAFSYCLPSYSSLSPGWLTFGRGLGGALPVGAAWAPLVYNPRAPKFYYVGLSGLGVGGVRVPISEDIFRLTDSGYGGVIIDIGTAVTTLPMVAYEALRDAFTAKTSGVRAPRVSIFDTCYNQSLPFQFPSISFYFIGGPVLTLASHGFLIPVDGVEILCFAFAPSASGLTIIGNVQQTGIQISIDEARGYIGFGPNLRFVVNVLPSPRAVTVSIYVDVVVASNCGRLRRRYRLLSASSQEFIASLRRLGQAENAWLSLFPLTAPKSR